MIDHMYYNELIPRLFFKEMVVRKRFHKDCSEDLLMNMVVRSICKRYNLSNEYVKKILGLPINDKPNTIENILDY